MRVLKSRGDGDFVGRRIVESSSGRLFARKMEIRRHRALRKGGEGRMFGGNAKRQPKRGVSAACGHGMSSRWNGNCDAGGRLEWPTGAGKARGRRTRSLQAEYRVARWRSIRERFPGAALAAGFCVARSCRRDSGGLGGRLRDLRHAAPGREKGATLREGIWLEQAVSLRRRLAELRLTRRSSADLLTQRPSTVRAPLRPSAVRWTLRFSGVRGPHARQLAARRLRAENERISLLSIERRALRVVAASDSRVARARNRCDRTGVRNVAPGAATRFAPAAGSNTTVRWKLCSAVCEPGEAISVPADATGA